MHGCDVWWARVDEVRAAHAELLDGVERGRRDRYRLPADRDRFTLGRAVSRLAVGALLGIAPATVRLDSTCKCGEPHGKPVVAEPGGPELSISHSGDWVLVAVSGSGPVGVDVEQLSRPLDVAGLAGHVLTADERAQLSSVDTDRQQEAFVRYWTRKEALVKATGEGLAAGMDSVQVSAPDQPAAVLSWAGRPGIEAELVLSDLPTEDRHLAALAVRSRQPVAVRYHRATGLLAGA